MQNAQNNNNTNKTIGDKNDNVILQSTQNSNDNNKKLDDEFNFIINALANEYKDYEIFKELLTQIKYYINTSSLMTFIYGSELNTFNNLPPASNYKKRFDSIINKHREYIITYLLNTMNIDLINYQNTENKNFAKEVSQQVYKSINNMSSQDIRNIMSNIVQIILECKNEINNFMNEHCKQLINDLINLNKIVILEYVYKVHCYVYRLNCLDESIMKVQNELSQ